ncbi:MAG TPA: beta-propeller domain-containing protein [Acidimicrobiales bacterium]|nr:beta-propeller domain-containing protein [Acidimicrobiales bacterium]
MLNKTVGVISVAALLAGGVAAAAVWGAGPAGPPNVPTPVGPLPPGGTPAVATARLVAYSSCDQFLASVKAQALQLVGPYGLPGPGQPVFGMRHAMPASSGPAAVPASSGPAAGASTSAAAGAVSPAYSGTNDQVVGVDEPDTVKTDGKLMAVVRQSPAGIELARVDGPAPRIEGFLPLPQAGDITGLFLTGGDAVVISQVYDQRLTPGGSSGPAWLPTTRATVVGLSDPAHPRVLRSFDLSGSDDGARLIAGRVVLVLSNRPRLAFSYPTDGTAAAQTAATEHNRAVIESSTLADWLPTVTSHPSGRTTTAGCARVLHPTTDSGVGTVAVVSIDPASDQPGPETVALGDARTVYASTRSLYVATDPLAAIPVRPPILPEAVGPAEAGAGRSAAGPAVANAPAVANDTVATDATPGTDIAGFDLSDPTRIRYLGSAAVPGQLIGSYALSTYHGDLRVATTVGQATPAPGEGTVPAQQSDSRITVLAPQAGSLVEVGSIAGLGAGEKIYAVRYVGPLAYVVTFRQTDPLYIVDLSDPAHPVLRGRLALTGFSSLLQPLDGSLLLGVGQGVDPGLRQTGLQLSVFDVSDPQAPVLRSRLDLGQAYSPAQADPHALLWWPARRLVAMPLSQPAGNFSGMMVWNVGAGGTLQPVARLAQPTSRVPGPQGGAPAGYWTPYPVERAVVVGDLLYTVSPNGIMATDMNSWNRAAWLPFT